jgi:hypothetical protein
MRQRLLLAVMRGLMMFAPRWTHAQTGFPLGVKAHGAGACGDSQKQSNQQDPTD